MSIDSQGHSEASSPRGLVGAALCLALTREAERTVIIEVARQTHTVTLAGVELDLDDPLQALVWSTLLAATAHLVGLEGQSLRVDGHAPSHPSAPMVP